VRVLVTVSRDDNRRTHSEINLGPEKTRFWGAHRGHAFASPSGKREGRGNRSLGWRVVFEDSRKRWVSQWRKLAAH